MPQLLDIQQFMARRDAGLPVVDARSPAEYAHGHIPGALNIPTLSDDERARVGTAYAKGGPEAAVHLALNLVGPQLAGKLAHARETLRSCLPSPRGHTRPEVLLHCWRGGMRSNAMAWLLELGGYSALVLEGGYNSYRRHVRQTLATCPAPVLVLGGMTGSGKTAMLHALAERGHQVIDLEGLANHRGSAFGAVGLGAQPSGESMENALCEMWRSLDPSRPVWLEDEDKRIGNIALCDEFFSHIRTGRLVLVEIPFETRVNYLAGEYAAPQWQNMLTTCLWRLEKRLGSERTRRCADDIAAGRYREAVAEVLVSYDALYRRQLEKHGRPPFAVLQLATHDTALAAEQLAAVEKRLSPLLVAGSSVHDRPNTPCCSTPGGLLEHVARG